MDIHVLQSQPAQKVAFKDSSTVRVGNKLDGNKPPTQPSAMRPRHLVRGGFQPRLPTSLPPPGQQQQPSPLPRQQPVPLMPPAQLHPGAPQVVAPAPAVPLQSPPSSELMDVDPSAGPPSQAVAVQPVLQPLSLGTPKESDTAASCPAPTQQPSPQRQETLPLFVGPDAPSRPVPEPAPVVTAAGTCRLSHTPPRCLPKTNHPLHDSKEEHLQTPGATSAQEFRNEAVPPKHVYTYIHTPMTTEEHEGPYLVGYNM
ncbi:proline-rich protein 2-like [Schistocerca americana]|uniref:proline-rich protein 2-like n=1 Tax=Schistocerca americana TaxID=7009 RepID=UPI001F4F96A0|nr:proline-rich protein 2-like [Schistocerca americana]